MDYKFCKKCGTKMEIDAIFCEKCGTKQEFLEKDKSKTKEQSIYNSENKKERIENWEPYNQYEKNEITRSSLLATRDALKLNRCIGRANFWYACMYLFVMQVILQLVVPSSQNIAGLLVELLTFSLVVRRANDSVSDSRFRLAIIVGFGVTIIGDIVPSLEVITAFIQLGIMFAVGLRKTDRSTKYERPQQ
ncbi:zinc-ribbon domain-containing protein [Ligilactobacillus sp. WILCCON 0076]|uniref:Zinc-ribbon domain-containing protein n=1 Tax=Ligilactobacillus ubinensis TaxID=2876789 RepID=A0A9X2FLN0_9LACO|nr:zinc-ribbon domain-containing protein [Ligilactobacillus ubinensis]MCP0887545.1 zinc-ribbon domain-containing protein [Ligilactobacillus ubinensis]